MPYRLRYQAYVDFVPAGRGLGQDAAVPAMPGMAGGNQQTLGFFDAANVVSSTFLAADVTALLTAMATDLAAQMSTAATLARVQGFASGGG